MSLPEFQNMIVTILKVQKKKDKYFSICIATKEIQPHVQDSEFYLY